MHNRQNIYILLNLLAVFTPLISSILAANKIMHSNPDLPSSVINGMYYLAILLGLSVLTSLLAHFLIKQEKFYITMTVLMFTFNWINSIFVHKAGGVVLIISFLLIQYLFVVPALIYGIAIQFKTSGSQ